MTYYHDLITEKSWQALQDLRRQYNFILIGGWAVYLYSGGLKSKDIDFICDYKELERLRADYDLVKNDRLKKYEVHWGEFDIDIYVPHFSALGLPAEDVQKMTRSVGGFTVPEPEVLLILKQKAFQERRFSAKGEKDKIDIVALLKTGLDLRRYQILLKEYHLEPFEKDLKALLRETRSVPELNLNEHAFKKLREEIFSQS